MTAESEAVRSVAGLMALAARTAPKSVGLDSITIKIVSGSDQEKIADHMLVMGKELGMGFFTLNAGQVRESDAMILIGVEGRKTLGINCGGCGFDSCKEMAKALTMKKKSKSLFPGPNCTFKVSDLGIAVGSAVKTAGIHNVDNRVMYSAGVAAMQLGLLPECSIAYGIPLKASGKNIYFDKGIHEH